MQQHEFILMASKCQVKAASQNDTGDTFILLREGIEINHNYKKKDQMIISFPEFGFKFIIPDKKALQEVYTIHLTNKDAKQMILDYCTKEFKTCD